MSDDERTEELRRLVSGVKPLPPEVRGRFEAALEEADLRLSAMSPEERRDFSRKAFERVRAMAAEHRAEKDAQFTVTQLPSGRVECVCGENKVSAGTDVEAVGLMREVLREMECPSGGCGLAARAVADSVKHQKIADELILGIMARHING